MSSSIRAWNARLTKKGIRVLPLRYQGSRALIYVYRPSFLSTDLRNHAVTGLLAELGYDLSSSERCVAHLIRRLAHSSEFPHEIGIFLGYPPADVLGFIQNKAKNCKAVGTWKVYGDVEASRRKFAQFQNCTSHYLSYFQIHRSLEKLAVAMG